MHRKSTKFLTTNSNNEYNSALKSIEVVKALRHGCVFVCMCIGEPLEDREALTEEYDVFVVFSKT